MYFAVYLRIILYYIIKSHKIYRFRNIEISLSYVLLSYDLWVINTVMIL